MTGKFEGLDGCGPLAVVCRELVEHSKLLDGQGIGPTCSTMVMMMIGIQ